MSYSLETVENKISEFDKMKFIDEDGIEKISGRELAKALGYKDWQNFKAAINRTNNQIKNTGGDEICLLIESGKQTKISLGPGRDGVERFQNRTIPDYHLTRRQAINVANNCDTSKPEVALVQEYLYDTSEVGEKAINIFNKMKDRQYIESRTALSASNKNFSGKCLEHNSSSKDLSKIHNACDKALYNKSTQEIKDEYGKSNRPKADFLGSVMCSAESFAKDLSSLALDNQNADGADECIKISTEIHEEIRNQIIEKSGYTPEQLITGEDVKLVEKRYNKLTDEQLKAAEIEY